MNKYMHISKVGSVGNWVLDIEDVLSIVRNPGAFTKNRKKLNGMDGMVLEDWNGGQYIAQISGYNGNSGMYCYLVHPDDSLERTL